MGSVLGSVRDLAWYSLDSYILGEQQLLLLVYTILPTFPQYNIISPDLEAHADKNKWA